MATTNCLRVARFVPMAIPANGDLVQIQDATTFLTRFIATPTGGGGGATLPAPTREGDVLQADASLAWVAGQIEGGSA
jgi:hypothetical protein